MATWNLTNHTEAIMRVSIDGGETFIEVKPEQVVIEDAEHYLGSAFRVRFSDEGVLVRQTGGEKTGPYEAALIDYHEILGNPVPTRDQAVAKFVNRTGGKDFYSMTEAEQANAYVEWAASLTD